MKLADNKSYLVLSNGAPSVELPARVPRQRRTGSWSAIRKLYAQTGMFTTTQALSTASQSAITYIDGDKGELLLYRGYPIEQLATNCDYLGNPATSLPRRAA
jgi:citrate synthase